MVFPIAGGNESKGYEISNSLRFNDGDSPKLNRTPSSSGNRKTFTISCWFKRSNISLGDIVDLYSAGQSSGGTGSFSMHILAGDNLRLDANGVIVLKTNRLFRDPSAWYHYVLVVDTTQATASNRFKMYINGVEETSFATDNRSSISQNTDLRWNMNEGHGVGYNYYDTTYYYDGYITEFHNVDGTAKAQTDFGEFDDNGVWIPKKYTGTYGTNGFFLEFQQTGTSANSSGIGADTSGNDNHFTPTNLAATDITEDTCTNNFATLNPLKTTSTNANLSEGNTKFSVTANGASLERNAFATITFPNSGKWYMETKVTHSALSSDSGNQVYVGVLENPNNIDHLSTDNPNSVSTNGIFTDVRLVGTLSDAIQYGTNGSSSTYNTDPDWSSGDIIGIALDMDNGRIYYHLNGTYYDDASGNVPNPATPANHNHSFTVPDNGLAFFISVLRYSTSTVSIETNFGNPAFSISSGNTDGKYGNFEYAVPSGYYALCTKRLAEFG
jgi:hypothetical protein